MPSTHVHTSLLPAYRHISTRECAHIAVGTAYFSVYFLNTRTSPFIDAAAAAAVAAAAASGPPGPFLLRSQFFLFSPAGACAL